MKRKSAALFRTVIALITLGLVIRAGADPASNATVAVSATISALIEQAANDENSGDFVLAEATLNAKLGDTSATQDKAALQNALAVDYAKWARSLLVANKPTSDIKSKLAQAFGMENLALANATLVGDLRTQESIQANLGALYTDLDQYGKGRAAFQQAAALAASLGDKRRQEVYLRHVAYDSDLLGERHDALEAFQEALAIAEANRDLQAEEEDRGNIGVIYENIGQYDKALAILHQSLASATTIGNAADEESCLTDIGGVYLLQGRYGQAQTALNRSLKMAEHLGDCSGQVHDLSNLGTVFADLGQYDRALTQANAALAVATRLGEQRSVAGCLANVGRIYSESGQYTKALTETNRSLELAAEIGDAYTQEKDWGNLGIIYRLLGRYDNALNAMNVSLALAVKCDDRESQVGDMGNIGLIYEALGQYDNAVREMKRSLALAVEVGDSAAQEQDEGDIGLVYDDCGRYAYSLAAYTAALKQAVKIGDIDNREHILGNIGTVYGREGLYAKALKVFTESLQISERIGDLNEQDHDLTNIGDDYISLGRLDKARRALNQALALQRKIGDKATEAVTLSDRMRAEQKLGNPALAVFYGKESVNTFQGLRAAAFNLGARDPGAQKSYLTRIQGTYRQLAELLIHQGRLPEAQQILRLLKEQDFFQYIHPSDLEDPDKALRFDPATLTAREARWEEELNAAGPSGLTAFDARLDASPGVTSPQASAFAAELAPDCALIYTIVEPERVRLIVVAARRPGAEPSASVPGNLTAISSDRLYKDVLYFRNALTDPSVDPRPMAREFYTLLIKPVLPQIRAAHARRLLFSLDDALRYIPPGALVDPVTGRYLVQDYAVETVTLIGESRSQSGSKRPDILGLGSSQARAVGDHRFPALPGVLAELNGIVKQPGETTGLLPGRRLLDAEFTPAGLSDQLKSHQFGILHIASHFVINTADTNSFLLFGDGSTQTVADVRLDPDRFAGIDLLTLSACDTGEDMQVGDGHEIEGFGALMQQLGAKNVIASLWPVSDSATPELMTTLYRILSTGAAPAEALQKAQVAMIAGTMRGPIRVGERGTLLRLPGPIITPTYPQGLPKFSHPYYWAPFILIGN